MILTGRLVVGGGTCLVFLFLGVTAFDHRDRPGTLPFAFLCLLFGLLSVLVAAPVDGLFGLMKMRVGVYEIITVVWLLFAIAYTGRGPAVSRQLLAGLTGFSLLVLFGIGAGPIVSAEFTPLLLTTNYISQSLASALGVYGLFVAVRSIFVYDDLPTGGIILISTAGFGFVCLAVLFTMMSGVNNRTVLDAMLAVSSLVAFSSLVTVHRYPVFAGSASAGHLAREQVLDEMDAAVVIADRAGRILDCNGAFETMFGVNRRQAIGEQLDIVAGSLSVGDQEPLTTTDGSRICDVDRTVLTATGENPIGEAYRIRDVTDSRTREQRLDVFNRVLRHNLRNNLDAMHAFAETLEMEPHRDDASDIGARISDTASELSDIGSTVGRCERLLGREQLTEESVDISAVAQDIVDGLTEQYPGTATVSTDDAPVVRTDPELLEAVLHEVVENGLKHGPGADAHVAIESSRSPSGVRIAVRDNGPGIPSREQTVLLDGEESPLRHGSGVGLWLVNWGLSQLGGELAIEVNDGAGSVVEITIPDSTGGS